MANSFEYIEKTLPRVVDKVFMTDSLTEMLLNAGEIKLDFLDARTVKVFRLASTGLQTYNRGGHGSTNTRGSAQSSTETFTLSQERYSEIPLDKLDTLDDGETVLGSLAGEFIRTKVVPEFDTYRFSKMASYTNTTFGNRISETIAANTIISKLNLAYKWMTENGVGEADQVIFCSPDVMNLIRNTTELYKKLSQSEYKGKVSFSIENYENRPIVVVPSDRFYTDAIFANGYYPSETSKVINFMVVDRRSPIIIKKLDYAHVYNSTDQNGAYLGFVGYLLTNLYYHDLFVTANKVTGIYASVSNVDATTVGSALRINAVAGLTATKTVITSALTAPAGIIYDSIYTSTSAIAIGDATSGLTLITLGSEFVPNATHNYFCASYNGVAVAITKDFTTTLPVGE